MPELPEVETTRRGIEPHISGKIISKIIIRQRSLRWPIPSKIKTILPGLKVDSVTRRAKYLLLSTSAGTLIIHLGMSGSMRVIDAKKPTKKHDHVDIILENGKCLRYNDPRRFGCMLWEEHDPMKHQLLIKLGPEPLETTFSNKYLHDQAKNKKVNIKQLIMNSHIVVGVGNIYANEALFAAKIHPLQPANQLTLDQSNLLVKAIKKILRAAIKQGGTTLKDFTQTDGKPGYFRHQLKIYGRAGEKCHECDVILEKLLINQRNTTYCPNCQQTL